MTFHRLNRKIVSNLLLSINIILLILAIGSSYYRFVIAEDYIVSYEGECDPDFESCFFDCEDDECSQYYYFNIVERQAGEIHSLCGKDITQCNEAYVCPQNVEFCEITFCNPEIEDVDTCKGKA